MDEELKETLPSEDKTENEPFRLKVKYNHEELYLPEDEAAAFAQKGMNYDKLQKNYDELKKQSELSRDEELCDFIKENPSLDVSAIPDEVITDFLEGKSIKESYLRYGLKKENESLVKEIEKLKGLLEIREEEKRNEASANGPLSTPASVSGEYYSSEELDALSDSDLENNLERAVKSMSRLSEK